MERAYKEKMILQRIQNISELSDIIIDILFGILCG